MMRRFTLPLAVTAGLLVAACSPSDEVDDTSAGSDTAATDVPEATTAETAETAETAPPATTDETQPESSAAVTTLAPDPSADLPTVRPDEVTTVTTLPGPLPAPTIQLIEEATYDQPVDITSRPDDLRMMVIEKGGRVIAADAESSTTVLDMADITDAAGVTFTAGGAEQGLLGVAYHPVDPLVFVHFSAGNGDTVVAELAIEPVSAAADPASYRELLRITQPFSNHNGGELEFGPDGLLYLALGDGGSADDPDRVALDLSTPLGSILRFDPAPAADRAVSVPADNPYATGSAPDGSPADPLIWSSGLRNPWKFSFDALTGDLWIADVGQGDFEEINRAPADPDTQLGAGRGLDFGWSAFEGYAPFNDDQSPPSPTPPVAAYPHGDGDCSVSGGVVARDSSYVDLNGWYVYGDFCSGRLWALDTTTVPTTPSAEQQPTIVEIGNVPALTSVATGPDGDIYAVSLAGPVFRLAPA